MIHRSAGPARGRVCLLTVLLSATAARAEIAASSDDGFHVRHELGIEATSADVWQVLLEPAAWWAPAHTWSGDSANLSLEAAPGGCFCESWEGASAVHLTVLRTEPRRHLRLEGALGPLQSLPARGVMDFRLEPTGDGDATRLILEYRVAGVPGGDWAAPVDRVLGEQAARLRDHLEAAPPEPAGGAGGDQPSG